MKLKIDSKSKAETNFIYFEVDVTCVVQSPVISIQQYFITRDIS